MMTTSKKYVRANDDCQAIRKMLKGAKPVSAQVIKESDRGAYDMLYDDEIVVTWDNGHQTWHHDIFCGQDQLRGGRYRRSITLLGVVCVRPDGWDPGDDATAEMGRFAPMEQRRFAKAEALAEQSEQS